MSTWTCPGNPCQKAGSPSPLPESLKGAGIATDFDGNIWLATHFDVRRFDGQKWTIWTRKDLGMTSPDEDMPFSQMRVHDFDMLKGLWLTSCDYGGPGPNGGGGARWWDGNNWQGTGTPVDTGCVTSVFQEAWASTGSAWNMSFGSTIPSPTVGSSIPTLRPGTILPRRCGYNCGQPAGRALGELQHVRRGQLLRFMLAYYYGSEWHFINQDPSFNSHQVLIPPMKTPGCLISPVCTAS